MKGVFKMKKIIFCLLCIMACLNVFVVGAADASGHHEFQEIRIPTGSEAKLINSMDKGTIKNAYGKIKRKFWGWGVEVIVNNQKVEYVGDTVFAKKNNTSQTLKYVYYHKNEHSVTTSITASASLAGKGSGKIEAITASLDASIRGEIGKKTVVSNVESTEITIIVPPRKKLTVTIRGEARLNNGVCRYYILGIGVKKGEWEYIDVVNEYYDYYEENIY